MSRAVTLPYDRGDVEFVLNFLIGQQEDSTRGNAIGHLLRLMGVPDAKVSSVYVNPKRVGNVDSYVVDARYSSDGMNQQSNFHFWRETAESHWKVEETFHKTEEKHQ